MHCVRELTTPADSGAVPRKFASRLNYFAPPFKMNAGAVFVAITLMLATANAAGNCSWTDAASGTAFDLSQLILVCNAPVNDRAACS